VNVEDVDLRQYASIASEERFGDIGSDRQIQEFDLV
jgi:hypothetical protein